MEESADVFNGTSQTPKSSQTLSLDDGLTDDCIKTTQSPQSPKPESTESQRQNSSQNMEIDSTPSQTQKRKMQSLVNIMDSPGSKKKRNQVSQACSNCRQHKIKCDSQLPCSNCTKKGIECVIEAKKKRSRRKDRPSNTSTNDKSQKATSTSSSNQTETQPFRFVNETAPIPKPKANQKKAKSQFNQTSLNQPKDISNLVCLFLNEQWNQIDPDLPHLLDILNKYGTNEHWHKTGTLKDHLMNTMRILKLWKQDFSMCKFGLFHCAFPTNSGEVSILQRGTRNQVQNWLGEEAENLIYLFCAIPRHNFIFEILLSEENLWIPENGITIPQVNLTLTPELISKILILVMCDMADQWFDWQDDLFSNQDGKMTFQGFSPNVVWPGISKPGLWMNCVSRLGRLLSSCQKYVSNLILPPIFDDCTTILPEDKEKQARDLYWESLTSMNQETSLEDCSIKLVQSVQLNPYIAEPHVLLSQLSLMKGEFQQAERHASQALHLFCQWGTCYDKRFSWQTWVAFTRTLLQHSIKQTWPTNSWGMINLGRIEK